jgi:CheY-like chemotaxis protein
MTVVALVDDLMFLSRIREAAVGQGTEVKPVRTAAALLEACRSAPALVVVDLDSPRLLAAEAIRALRAEPAGASLPVVGFYSHVHGERAERGVAAGASRVMQRSAFVRELPALIAAGTAPA